MKIIVLLGTEKITRTSADFLWIWSLKTNLILIFKQNTKIFIQIIYLKMSSVKWQPFFSGLNALTHRMQTQSTIWYCSISHVG